MASLATIGRVALTAVLSPLFCLLGWVGPLWAVVALTLPVALESVASWHFMRPFRERLPSTGAPPPGLSDIFRFNIPLTVGGYFLSLSTVILAAFIARAPEPERMLPAYYLALGLASPAAFAATRLQTVVLAFPPADRHRGRTLRFAVAAGLVLGVLPLAFTLPGLAEIYYVNLQNLDPADLGLVRWTAATLVFFPLATALRGQSEGLSAWLKRPSAVLFGHSMFLVAILLVGLATLALGAPGCFVGALSLPVGSLVSSATMRLALRGRAAAAPTDPDARGR
ncbi:MAG: hypothetical protein MUE48_13365 [Desulfobacterales bacterium]|nr:hypothetical protein [Desulfobacterales bacterium]